ncbi:hypothetical protein Enr13x_42740 [Stieleria neptunia]|uniref:Uncharacterized protein n=1 Tax=Stieleria neptunia TaxID=2527979 RepID=A0A518HU79_9BACT|nr:hypothetical protein [Stieleria neptunia]QDV44408.1 hypothetical protein Enr13x_42740 [Stieleria neptunia]
MTSKSFSLTLGFLAAFCFAALPGCQDKSTTTVTEASDSDHDHSHDDGDHDHDGHDHDEHADHDEHGDHDHADHEGHDHDEHGDAHDHDFESLSEAVEEIESLRDTIRDGFAAGDADAAHDPLHHIGAVLIATENLIQTMDDSEQKTAAAAAVESLLDDFAAVDQGLHGSEESKAKGKQYDDVSKSIDEAIETLKKDAK